MPLIHPALRSFCALVFAMHVLFLGGCATSPSFPLPPQATLDAFALEGRFSLRYEDKNYSGRLSWRHEGADNTVLLSSPFGQGMAEISTRLHVARLTTSDGKAYEAADAETLTRQVLGYPLPLAQLADWVRGRAEIGADSGNVERDDSGRLLRLRHEDWTIEWGYEGDDPQVPPVRVFAERADGMELRLRIDEWNSVLPREARP